MLDSLRHVLSLHSKPTLLHTTTTTPTLTPPPTCATQVGATVFFTLAGVLALLLASPIYDAVRLYYSTKDQPEQAALDLRCACRVGRSCVGGVLAEWMSRVREGYGLRPGWGVRLTVGSAPLLLGRVSAGAGLTQHLPVGLPTHLHTPLLPTQS